ncbi:RNA dependent RNA polymerase-domain-containing protein [Mariannaea sp. PMI_226]|nr:RNA dependent RNA polymerase-domain-containing protein [Mariannaea sp. PMI_226]
MATRPQPSSKTEELHRTIRSLNADFKLCLEFPDPTLSPNKRKQQRRTEEQERINKIYSRSHFLSFNDPGHFSTCIGCFREQADQLLKQRATKEEKQRRYADTPTNLLSDPHRANSAVEERAVLQKLLLSMLQSPTGTKPSLHRLDSTPAPTPARRASRRTPPDFQDPNPKRTKERSAGEIDRAESVDCIPVRSRFSGQPATTLSYDASTNIDVYSTTVTQSRTSFTGRSITSSKASFSPSVFSTGITGDVSQSQATASSNFDSFAYSTQPPSRESFEKRLHQDGKGDSIRQQHSSATQLISSNSSHHLEVTEAHTSTIGVGFGHDSIVERTQRTTHGDLAQIWPKFPSPALNQAPLIIIWELTRAAIYCKVDLSGWDLVYKNNDNWHNQSKFRAQILNHPLFLGKGLPSACDSKTWSAALTSFSASHNVVSLVAELVYTEQSGSSCTIKLQRPCLKLGNRLSRRFGADRILEILLPPRNFKQTKDYEGLPAAAHWLINSSSHYFLGRLWIPFYTNEGKKTKKKDLKLPNGTAKLRSVVQNRVFLFAGDGNHFQAPEAEYPSPREALYPSIRTKMRRCDLLNWAVNIKKNGHQPMTKLFSRLALSLSNTWPTVVLEMSQIRRCKTDIINEDVNGKPGAVMNDGIGRISRSLARKVAACLNLTDTPCGFQARFGSAKGMWIVDVKDDGLDEEDWIEVYPSQEKWNCDFRDEHHRTFEVRDWPRELRTASLNQQFIPVLEAQARFAPSMRKTIAKHLADGLQKELDEQREAMEHPMDFRSWLQRTRSSDPHSANGVIPFAGGLPEREEDTMAYLLDAGFHPNKQRFLYEKAWEFRRRQTEQLKTRMNIQIPKSTYALMVVDFTEELAEGEVQLAFSSKFQVGDDSDTLLDGIDVLVARSPAHFASDIQKVRAVFKPGLRKLKDVVVFSTRGNSSLADMLSGGDYDGDRAWVCWDPEIVRNFTSAPVPPMPDLIGQGYIHKIDTRFEDILKMHDDLDGACTTFLRDALDFNMKQPLLGICTNFKERHCYYLNSVTSDTAVALCTLVSHLVDQSKQGLLFTDDDFRRLKEDMKMKAKEPEYEKEMSSSYRNRDGSTHILDYLKFDVAYVKVEEGLEAFSKSFNRANINSWDSDLSQLYNEAEKEKATSKTFKEIMKHLTSEIRRLERTWKDEMGKTRHEGSGGDYKDIIDRLCTEWDSISPPRGLENSKLVKLYCDEWNRDPRRSKWALLKASTTFKLCYDSCSKMPWKLAGQQLCWIKAMASKHASGQSAIAVTPEMWSVLKPDARKVKAFAARRDDAESVAVLEETMDFDDGGNPFDDT